MKSFNYIKISQPIGEYYLGSIKAIDIINNVDVLRRKDHQDYVQRDENKDRIKSISKYCKDPDATFPTPIILSINSNKINILESSNTIEYQDDDIIGEIIDGQHRILGIRLAIEEGNTDGLFDLPVIFMLDLEAWEKAYIFSTVNHNQKQVPSSLIYDLFNLINMEYRSPYASAHVIAKTLNTDTNSPFYEKIKMLGKRTSVKELISRMDTNHLIDIMRDCNIEHEFTNTSDKNDIVYFLSSEEDYIKKIGKLDEIKEISKKEQLSQGTFVKYVLKYLISKDPQEDEIRIKNNKKLEQNSSLPLREYFIDNEDDTIYKILINYFTAFKTVYHDEWDDTENFLLTRSIGFGAMIRIFVKILEIAFEKNDLRKEFFESIIQKFKVHHISFEITSHTSAGLETSLYNSMLSVLYLD